MRGPSPQIALLRGRLTWVRVCHAEPAACPACLRSIAEFLAAEMGRELQAAVDKPAEVYQAELGAHRCSLEQARELRRLTCKACIEVVSSALVVAESAELTHVDGELLVPDDYLHDLLRGRKPVHPKLARAVHTAALTFAVAAVVAMSVL